MKETIEVTYSAMGFEEMGETTFEMEVSKRVYEQLQEAEDEDEFLDSDYISEEMPGIHRKILRAIRVNMEDEGQEADDGIVETRLPWGAIRKDYVYEKSYENMAISADDDDIEYSVNLY